jgi:myo-inositol-1(or 4)-monophosphatase
MDDQHLEIARRAARAGAAELMRFRDSFAVQEKAPRDLVTDADVASQHRIAEVLGEAYPDYHFVGEEEGCEEPPAAVLRGEAGAPCWVVDPLDGTVNYVHRLQSFAVSIGLYAEGLLQVGVVYDPVVDEMFSARRGGGAWVDQDPLRPSRCQRLEASLVACSFPPGVRRDGPDVQQFVAMLESCQSLRRLGSCALNLCYVAAGRLDGYWASSIKPWDAAAGALILEEAGGQISHLDGRPFDLWDPRFCASANATLHQQMLDRLAL